LVKEPVELYESGEKEVDVFERVTDIGRRAIMMSSAAAKLLGTSQIETAHLVLGILDVGESSALACFRDQSTDTELLRWLLAPSLTMDLTATVEDSASKTPFSNDYRSALSRSIQVAIEHGHDYISTGHLFIASVDKDEIVRAAVLEAAVNMAAFSESVKIYDAHLSLAAIRAAKESALDQKETE
jgi:ATP-dependent Clp protease ATP-binding subunit ClpA